MATGKAFPLLIFLFGLTLTSHVAAYCKGFKQSRNYFTTTSSDEQIVSKGYVCDRPNSNYGSATAERCDAKSECPVMASGMVNTVGTNNLSLSHEDALPLYALIPTKTYFTPPSFLYSLSGTVMAKSDCIPAHIANGTVNDTTTAGYYTFVPTLLCIEGTLNRCTDGPVDDGTAIQVCAANALDLGLDGLIPNGVHIWVDTDVETARNLTRNPAESIDPVPKEAGISLEELGISDARKSFHQRNFLLGLGVLTIILIW